MRFFLVLLGLFFLPPVVGAAPPYRVAVDYPYPPFAYTTDAGELSGFDVDMAKALCAELAVRCLLQPMSFEAIIPALAEGGVDFAVAGITPTREREQLIDFSESYHRSPSIFVEKIRPGYPRMHSGTLQGKKIAVQKGTTHEIYLREAYKNTLVIQSYTKFEDLFTALQAEEVDLVLVDGFSAYERMKRPDGAVFEQASEPIHSELLSASSHIGVSKKHPGLDAQLNSALHRLRASGEYHRISRKYFWLPGY